MKEDRKCKRIWPTLRNLYCFEVLSVPKIHKVSAAQHENLESNVQYTQLMENAPDWAILVLLKTSDD